MGVFNDGHLGADPIVFKGFHVSRGLIDILIKTAQYKEFRDLENYFFNSRVIQRNQG